MLEREISRLGQTVEAHLAEPECEARERRVAALEADLEATLEYWREVRGHADTVTAHSRARTADEYIALELAATIPVERGPRIDYKALKERIDIVEHIGRSTDLRKSGRTFIGRCPLPDHDDSSPSLYVYPHTRSFYCFGCRRGGDVIDFANYMGANDLEP